MNLKKDEKQSVMERVSHTLPHLVIEEMEKRAKLKGVSCSHINRIALEYYFQKIPPRDMFDQEVL